MIDFLPVQTDNAALVAQMADPSTRIVSMTVTEAGYFLNASTKTFDPDHPDIQHDVQNPDRPKTLFGAMVAALRLLGQLSSPVSYALAATDIRFRDYLAGSLLRLVAPIAGVLALV